MKAITLNFILFLFLFKLAVSQTNNDTIELVCNRKFIKKIGFPEICYPLLIKFQHTNIDTMVFMIANSRINENEVAADIYFNMIKRSYKFNLYVNKTEENHPKYLKILFFDEIEYSFRKIKRNPKQFKLKKVTKLKY